MLAEGREGIGGRGLFLARSRDRRVVRGGTCPWPVCCQEMPLAATLKRWLLHPFKGHMPRNIFFFLSPCLKLHSFWLSPALCLSVALLSASYPGPAVAVASGL